MREFFGEFPSSIHRKKLPPSAHQLEFLKFFGNKPVPRSLLNPVKAQLKTTLFTLASMLFSGALVQNASAANTTVNVGPGGNYTFDPPTVSISVGDSVTLNLSPYHSTTSGTADGTADGLWDSGVSFSTPNTYSHTFTQAGTSNT